MSAARKPKTKRLQIEKGARGRPTNFDERLRDIMLNLYEKGKTDSEVAKLCNINAITLDLWKAKYADFFRTLKEIKSVADEFVEVSLYRRATGYSHKAVKVFCYEGKIIEHEYIEHYPPDPTSMIFWLKNRQREKWRDKHDVVVQSEDDLLTDDQLRAKISALIKARARPEEREVNDAADQGQIAQGDKPEHQD